MFQITNDEWESALADVMKSPEVNALEMKLREATESGSQVIPRKDKWFRAINELSPRDVRVTLIAQDPYPRTADATGHAFSVGADSKIPASLRNIFRELHDDLGTPIPASGNLEPWSRQGVLLLNTCLTVEEGKANIHQKWGWQAVTDQIIRHLSAANEHTVFLLWGNPAHKKAELIESSKHLVIKTAHPSPLSAYRGFFGKKQFSQANDYLVAHNRQPIDWSLHDHQQALLI